jgi:hypothetical protein
MVQEMEKELAGWVELVALVELVAWVELVVWVEGLEGLEVAYLERMRGVRIYS